MPDKLERLIGSVYKKWKSDQSQISQPHPEEETFACFLENKLSPEETEQIKAHLLSCDSCAEAVATSLRLKPNSIKEVPQELRERLKDLLKPEEEVSILEIILKLKEKALEILNTTGDVLWGEELVPAPVLRSRQIKDFKDEITILKDFKDIRVEAKIENKGGSIFDLEVVVKEKKTLKTIKDLRVTLLRDDLELASYLTDKGMVTFEHVLLGKYRIEISNLDNKLASILLDIKV